MHMAHMMHGSYVNHANAQLHALACSHALINENSFHQVTCIPIDDRTARIDLVDGTRAYRPQTLISNATPVLITPEQVMRALFALACAALHISCFGFRTLACVFHFSFALFPHASYKQHALPSV